MASGELPFISESGLWLSVEGSLLSTWHAWQRAAEVLGVIGIAGRAGEEIVYGGDEVSTINQRRLVLARRIVTKLVVSNAMSDTPTLADRMISNPVRHGERSLRQIILRKVRPSPALRPRLCSPDLHGQSAMDMSCLLLGIWRGLRTH